MCKNRQIHIREPCGESCGGMLPSGDRRHCSSCLKTVLEFSLMSDREVLSWLADANTKVCGRFSNDQVNRSLLPVQERKRRLWSIWNFLLAGLLVSSRAPAQTKSPVAPVSQHDQRLMGAPL